MAARFNSLFIRHMQPLQPTTPRPSYQTRPASNSDGENAKMTKFVADACMALERAVCGHNHEIVGKLIPLFNDYFTRSIQAKNCNLAIQVFDALTDAYMKLHGSDHPGAKEVAAEINVALCNLAKMIPLNEEVYYGLIEVSDKNLSKIEDIQSQLQNPRRVDARGITVTIEKWPSEFNAAVESLDSNKVQILLGELDRFYGKFVQDKNLARDVLAMLKKGDAKVADNSDIEARWISFHIFLRLPFLQNFIDSSKDVYAGINLSAWTLPKELPKVKRVLGANLSANAKAQDEDIPPLESVEGITNKVSDLESLVKSLTKALRELIRQGNAETAKQLTAHISQLFDRCIQEDRNNLMKVICNSLAGCRLVLIESDRPEAGSIAVEISQCLEQLKNNVPNDKSYTNDLKNHFEYSLKKITQKQSQRAVQSAEQRPQNAVEQPPSLQNEQVVRKVLVIRDVAKIERGFEQAMAAIFDEQIDQAAKLYTTLKENYKTLLVHAPSEPAVIKTKELLQEHLNIYHEAGNQEAIDAVEGRGKELLK